MKVTIKGFEIHPSVFKFFNYSIIWYGNIHVTQRINLLIFVRYLSRKNRAFIELNILIR